MFRFEMLQARNVSLEIRDLQGRIVDTIERGQLSAGEHQVQYDVTALGGGIYTYTLIADGMRMTKKFIVQ
jgi:flagellar hook assembly protein FlgD